MWSKSVFAILFAVSVFGFGNVESGSCANNLINIEVSHFEDVSGNLTLDEIKEFDSNNLFLECKDQIFNKKPSLSAHWFKITYKNIPDNDYWLIWGDRFSTWIIDFYYTNLSDKDSLYCKRLETYKKNPPRLFSSKFYGIPLVETNFEAKTVYVRVFSGFPVIIHFEILHTEELISKSNSENNLRMLFIGAIIAIVLYNAIVFITSRQYFYLIYCFYLLIFIILATLATGHPIIEFKFIYTNLITFCALHNVLITVFFIISLDILRFSLKHFQIVLLTSFILIIALLFIDFTSLINYTLKTTLYQFLYPLHFIFILSIGFYYLFKGDTKTEATTFILSLSVLVISIIFHILVINNIFPENIYTQNIIYFGIIIHSIFFSIALGIKLNNLKKENLLIQQISYQQLEDQNRKLELAAKKSRLDQQRYLSILNNEVLSVVIVNAEGKCLFANDLFLDLFGISESDISNNIIYLSDFLTDEEKDSDIQLTNKNLNIKTAFKGKNEKTIYLNVSTMDFYGYNNEAVVFMNNISENVFLEKELIRSEQQYRVIFEGSYDGILIINKELDIIDCNQSFCNIVKYNKKKLLNMSILELINNKWNQPHRRDEMIEHLLKKENYVFEIEYLNSSGKTVPVEVSVQQLNINKDLCFLFIVREISEKKDLEKQLYSVMTSTEEAERSRYAKELHDGLGPLLSTCLIYQNAILKNTEKKVIDRIVWQSIGFIEEGLNSIKEISNNLSPIIINKHGLIHAVRSFIEKLNLVSNIEFSIESDNYTRKNELTEITLYRVLIELINNSLKHAKSDKIRIIFKQSQINKLVIEYMDNGTGFDYQKTLSSQKGYGISNIENRINKIGGDLYYNTSLGKGVFVRIILYN